MGWTLRELTAEETHGLRRAVSADGHTELVTMHHELDDAAGTWHLGAVDGGGRVVATSSLYAADCPVRPGARPGVVLRFMAVDPPVQRCGIGSAVMTEIIRRLLDTETRLLWADARDSAVPFYERFGFEVIQRTQHTPAETGRPHQLIGLDLGAIARTSRSHRYPSPDD